MSSSLPVPSKAALTALRGLVLGTSCTIALIAEDRRRKINNAMRVIENGERIKSAKAYRPGGAALALAMEEEALWDPRFGSVAGISLALRQHHDTEEMPRPSAKRKRQGPQLLDVQQSEQNDAETLAEVSTTGFPAESEKVVATEESDGNGTTNNNSTVLPVGTAQRTSKTARLSITPLPKPTASRKPSPSWVWANTDVVRFYSFPTVPEIIAQMHEACNTKDSLRVTAALQTVLKAMKHNVAPDNLDRSWMEATALLCRTCQEEGRLDDAAQLLYQVICRGPLEESDYLSHEPFTLIEALLARSQPDEQSGDVNLANIDAAVNLFLPRFKDGLTGVNTQIYNLGRRLLKLCFSAHRLQRIFGVYRRCNLVAGEQSNDLTSWFLKKLHENQDYVSVVKVFISTFSQSSPTKASVQAVGGLVVDSVELANNYRPEEVLQRLHSIYSGLNIKLNPDWVMRLFLSHWKKHGNFEEIEAMFEQLQTPGLKDSVSRSYNIYRIMVELALEAGEEAKADSYLMLAVRENRTLASGVRLLGVLARFHAADGDWEAVRADFEAMNQHGTPAGPAGKVYGQVFVPVLKVYAESHTVRETEVFLKSYTDELQVPLCSYLVTLMAKQYAAIRDVSSLVDWLDYCSRAGFPVDAAFTNAILVRCRRQWKFPFRDLRSLFRKIRVLNPDFVDKHTAQIMADAALEDSRYSGRAAKGRLLSLRVDANVLPARGKHARVEDVILAMKEALRTDSPRRAVWIYKRALHFNMPFSQQALRLAVQAELTAAPNDYNGAYGLLRGAQSRGEDVTPIINYLLGKQLSSIASSTTHPSDAEAIIQETLAQYHKAGIRLTETSLHRAALTCLKTGHFRGAIAYAHKAAAARGPAGGGPCFNLQNFRILIVAYAELVDAEGIRETIRRGLASHYREDGACRTALRHARDRVLHSRARPVSCGERARARELVEEGIERVVEVRRRLRAEARHLEKQAVEIMRRAALDAGREEVDFGGVPWLGGVKGAGDDAGAAEKGDGNSAESEAGEDGFLTGGMYAELERTLLEGSGTPAVEAY
ncbi:hypothetical protein N657DRAFT_643046 [Parathielavia appendiculata]|uniref:Uncharacterized protein n=1 Tax=Parathielavia appendiculata TaxID=2587402 RepID=A0AAN6Z5S9_9PEZI|nr:hypothetical protein N657DRAFT_643046 [Parathielavia appendiculata]